MTKAFIVGSYEESTKLLSFILLICEYGKASIKRGNLRGSLPETQASAMGILLKILFQNGLNATIYTNFKTAVDVAEGRIKAFSKRSKDYVNYLKRVRDKINITFSTEIPEDEDVKKYLNQITANTEQVGVQNPFKQQKQVGATVKWQKPLPKFRVVVYNPNESILCELDSYDFGGELGDAVYFSDWYEKEGKDKNSMFYGCRVERYGIPKGKKGE